MTGVFTTFTSCFINAYPNKKLLGYNYFEQMRDIFPSFMIAVVMLGCVLAIQLLQLSTFVTLALQLVVGVVVYCACALVLRLTPCQLLLAAIKKKLRKGQ